MNWPPRVAHWGLGDSRGPRFLPIRSQNRLGKRSARRWGRRFECFRRSYIEHNPTAHTTYVPFLGDKKDSLVPFSADKLSKRR